MHLLNEGTVFEMMIEKDDLINGEILRECSLSDTWKSVSESWPLEVCKKTIRRNCYILNHGNSYNYSKLG